MSWLAGLSAFMAGGVICVVLFAAFLAPGGSGYMRRRESARNRVLYVGAALTRSVKIQHGDPGPAVVTFAESYCRGLASELALAAQELAE